MSDAAESLAKRVASALGPEEMPVIVGPTASGKTALAIALAEALGGEVVSVDSVQVYRGFDIGSGKATAEERARVPHHLIDVFDPLESVDAALFAEHAARAIADTAARGKRPIVCGGTFLWTKALLYGLAEAPPGDAETRARHRQLVEAHGREALHDELRRRDPEMASRLHPHDVVRVSRALEVIETTGKSLATWQQGHGFRAMRYPARLFGIRTTSEELTARIEARVRNWLRDGWIEEVRDLLNRGYGDARAMGSVGYREVRQHVEGLVGADELASIIVRSTRVFARRQRTWLNHVDVAWL